MWFSSWPVSFILKGLLLQPQNHHYYNNNLVFNMSKCFLIIFLETLSLGACVLQLTELYYGPEGPSLRVCFSRQSSHFPELGEQETPLIPGVSGLEECSTLWAITFSKKQQSFSGNCASAGSPVLCASFNKTCPITSLFLKLTNPGTFMHMVPGSSTEQEISRLQEELLG